MRNTSVLVVVGSARPGSHTKALCEAIESSLTKLGARAEIWDSAAPLLPIADAKYHHDPSQHSNADVRSLVSKADIADAIVLSSPIYHNSFSGVLKNIIDHLSRKQFLYKPVGLVSHGSNASTQAVDQLRLVTRSVGGVAIPTQVCSRDEDFTSSLDETGVESLKVTDQALLHRVERFSAELLAFVPALQLIPESLFSPT